MKRSKYVWCKVCRTQELFKLETNLFILKKYDELSNTMVSQKHWKKYMDYIHVRNMCKKSK